MLISKNLLVLIIIFSCITLHSMKLCPTKLEIRKKSIIKQLLLDLQKTDHIWVHSEQDTYKKCINHFLDFVPIDPAILKQTWHLKNYPDGSSDVISSMGTTVKFSSSLARYCKEQGYTLAESTLANFSWQDQKKYTPEKFVAWETNRDNLDSLVEITNDGERIIILRDPYIRLFKRDCTEINKIALKDTVCLSLIPHEKKSLIFLINFIQKNAVSDLSLEKNALELSFRQCKKTRTHKFWFGQHNIMTQTQLFPQILTEIDYAEKKVWELEKKNKLMGFAYGRYYKIAAIYHEGISIYDNKNNLIKKFDCDISSHGGVCQFSPDGAYCIYFNRITYLLNMQTLKLKKIINFNSKEWTNTDDINCMQWLNNNHLVYGNQNGELEFIDITPIRNKDALKKIKLIDYLKQKQLIDTEFIMQS